MIPTGHFASYKLVCQWPAAAGRRANSRRNAQPGCRFSGTPPVIGQSVVRYHNNARSRTGPTRYGGVKRRTPRPPTEFYIKKMEIRAVQYTYKAVYRYRTAQTQRRREQRGTLRRFREAKYKVPADQLVCSLVPPGLLPCFNPWSSTSLPRSPPQTPSKSPV